MRERRLLDLVSVGKATVEDFRKLGITEVRHLKRKNARRLVEQLEAVTGERIDPCVEDVFRAAIAQAEDPHLPHAKCQWHY